MISPRYALSFIACAALVLVPTLIHTYVGLTAEDGRSIKAISRSFADLQSVETDRNAQWVKKTFQSHDWIERNYNSKDWRLRNESPLLLFVGRSYDPKRLYHHPELALLHGADLETLGTVHLPRRTERPIHLLKGKLTEGGKGLAIYALLYDEQFIDNPYLFQLQNAFWLLFQARRPMTLFFVYDARPSPERSLEDSRALLLLNEAIEDFLSQTPNA